MEIIFLKPMTLFFDLGNTLLYSLDPGDENIKIACVHAAAAFAELGYLIRPNDLAAAHYHNLTRYYAILIEIGRASCRERV